MKTALKSLVVLATLLVVQSLALAQTFPTDDPVIKNIWKEAEDSSKLPILAHQLFDVIGPRLVGTPQLKRRTTGPYRRTIRGESMPGMKSGESGKDGNGESPISTCSSRACGRSKGRWKDGVLRRRKVE